MWNGKGWDVMAKAKERFDAKWIPEPNTGCWLWTASIHETGYGNFGMPPITNYAHRAAWVLYRGPIPDGLVLDHICMVRSCVNPEHLRIVTRAVNNTENSNSAAAIYKRATVCLRCGGTLTDAPKYFKTRGKVRHCSACHKRRKREWGRNASATKQAQRTVP